jgi:hypothetical protein
MLYPFIVASHLICSNRGDGFIPLGRHGSSVVELGASPFRGGARADAA